MALSALDFLKYIIKFLGLFGGCCVLAFLGIDSFRLQKGPWPHRGRGELAMAYDGRLRCLGFTMYRGGRRSDTAAAYARRHLF